MKTCSIDGCQDEYLAKGYCKKHYTRVRNHKNPHTVLIYKYHDKECLVPDCSNKFFSLGYCRKHHSRFKKYGDPNTVKVVRGIYDHCSVDGCLDKHSGKGYCKKHYDQKYNIENKDLISQKNKEYRKKNLYSIREKERKYKEKNLEKVRARNRLYRKLNPDVGRTASRIRRARKFGNKHEPYTEQQVLEKYGTDCHICNTPIDLNAPRAIGKPGWEKGLHIDHVIELALGGPDTLDNTKPSHALCNLKKKPREMV